jgi:hypothetical protein
LNRSHDRIPIELSYPASSHERTSRACGSVRLDAATIRGVILTNELGGEPKVELTREVVDGLTDKQQRKRSLVLRSPNAPPFGILFPQRDETVLVRDERTAAF